MDLGSLMCAQIWVCALHTQRGVKHKQVDLEGQKLSLTLLNQWIEARIFGLEFRHSSHDPVMYGAKSISMWLIKFNFTESNFGCSLSLSHVSYS